MFAVDDIDISSDDEENPLWSYCMSTNNQHKSVFLPTLLKRIICLSYSRISQQSNIFGNFIPNLPSVRWSKINSKHNCYICQGKENIRVLSHRLCRSYLI